MRRNVILESKTPFVHIHKWRRHRAVKWLDLQYPIQTLFSRQSYTGIDVIAAVQNVAYRQSKNIGKLFMIFGGSSLEGIRNLVTKLYLFLTKSGVPTSTLSSEKSVAHEQQTSNPTTISAAKGPSRNQRRLAKKTVVKLHEDRVSHVAVRRTNRLEKQFERDAAQNRFLLWTVNPRQRAHGVQ